MLHRAARDRAVGQLLDLPHENVDRRLGHDDEVADEHTDGNDDPVAGKSRDDAAEVVARGHEADVHAGEENDEPEVCIRKAHADADELLALEMQGDKIEHREECCDGEKRDGDLLEIRREGDEEELPERGAVADLGDDDGGVAAAVRPEDETQNEHREDGTDGAERDEAEAVVRAVLIASDGGNADAHRHDERHGHRAGRHAAGVERYGKEILGHEHGENKNHDVEAHQHRVERDGEQHTQHGEAEKQSHADRHGDDEDHVRHGLHLIGEHLQVRLGNGDEKAQQKAERQHDADPARLGDARAHALAHRRHGQLRAEGEEHHAHHQQHRAEEKRHQHARRERGDGEAQDQHDGEDGQHRGKRFL